MFCPSNTHTGTWYLPITHTHTHAHTRTHTRPVPQVWVTWGGDAESWLPVNHSCDPNTWLEGLNLVARRPVEKGEEVGGCLLVSRVGG